MRLRIKLVVMLCLTIVALIVVPIIVKGAGGYYYNCCCNLCDDPYNGDCIGRPELQCWTDWDCQWPQGPGRNFCCLNGCYYLYP
jgi:hypothetical protein